MKTLPANLNSHKRTPEFDENSVPKGLLGEHTTAKDVWGLIRVTEGSLVYRILEPEVEDILLDPSMAGVVEPQVVHQVIVDGQVKFFVEFYRK